MCYRDKYYYIISVEQTFEVDSPTVMKPAFLLRRQVSRQLYGLQLKWALCVKIIKLQFA